MMKILRIFSIVAVLFIGQSIAAQETIKTMVYNLFEFPFSPPANKVQLLKDILETHQPDIFMVCELINENGAQLILDEALNHSTNQYEMAVFEANQSGDSELQQLIFYNKHKFSLEETDVLVTTVRDINRYQLKLKTTDHETDPVFLELFVAHLKSSTGTTNQNLRRDMIQEFLDYTAEIDPNAYVILAGDLNFYRATEPGYILLLDENNSIVMKDPIDAPGSWQDNEDFAYLHTQSTRLSNSGFGGGAGGGLDDRFDFIIVSENMLTDTKMMYVEDTYQAYGNNANCLNNRIDSKDCDGFYSQELRDKLYLMSDHLPVVMDLYTEKEFLLNNPDFSQKPTLTFPKGNVVENVLYINVNEPFAQNIFLEIFNVLGQKIHHISNSNQSQYQIDLTGLSTGIYYLSASHFDKSVYKFLKK